MCHGKLKPSATRNQTGWWQKTTITGFYILSKLHVASLHTILFPILYFIHYTIQVTSQRKSFRIDFYIIFCFKKIYVFQRLIINTISLLLYFNFILLYITVYKPYFDLHVTKFWGFELTGREWQLAIYFGYFMEHFLLILIKFANQLINHLLQFTFVIKYSLIQ